MLERTFATTPSGGILDQPLVLLAILQSEMLPQAILSGYAHPRGGPQLIWSMQFCNTLAVSFRPPVPGGEKLHELCSDSLAIGRPHAGVCGACAARHRPAGSSGCPCDHFSAFSAGAMLRPVELLGHVQ